MQKEESVQDEQPRQPVQQSFPMAVQTNGTTIHPYAIPEGAIELKPDLVPHRKAESPFEALSLRNAAKRNVGSFFTHLYMGLFPESGYELAHRRKIKLASGEQREINPDLIQRNLPNIGDKLIEVKSATSRSMKHRCFVHQAENYFYEYITSLNKGAERPVVRYALFRYGEYDNAFELHSQSEVESMRTLAMAKKEGLILATNQALLLFMLSRVESRDHESMEDANHFLVNGSAMTLLQDPRYKSTRDFFDAYEDKFMRNLQIQQRKGNIWRETAERRKREFKNVKRFAKEGFMHLNDLRYEQFQSDKHGPLVYRDVVLPQFPVTVYSIKNYDSWISDFRKYHKRILGRTGLRDLFAEDQRYQRRHPKKDGPF